MKDLANVIKHIRLNGNAGLSSDAARLGELKSVIEDALNEFTDIDQRFNWSDDLSEPRKNLWLNMVDILFALEETCSAYNSTLGIVNAAMQMPRLDSGDTVPAP